MPSTASGNLAQNTERLLAGLARLAEDLTADEVQHRTHDNTNSIGFDIWHVARTADNLINFAFERKPPVWMAQNLFEQWNLPKVAQGTGMPAEDAHALRFPDGASLAKYCLDVSASIVPQIRAMSDEYLDQTMTIQPQGEMAKGEIIGQVIINHGNNHLGAANVGVTALGKPGMGF
jgi:hypothetical protein